MMRLYGRSIIALCFLLLPYVITAQGSSENLKTNTISQIFEEFPVEGKLDEVAQELQVQLSQNPFGLPSSRNEQMVSSFSQAFATDSLLADAREAFHQNYNSALTDSIMRWIKTENTQRVLEAEREFYTLQGIRKRVIKKYELEQNPPSKSRIELIRSAVRSMSVSESEVESQVIIYQAIVSAFSKLNDQQSFTESQIDGFVNNYRSQIRPQVEQDVTNQLMLMYHGLESNVLSDYIAFYETGPGKWLSNTTSGSIHSAYLAAADRFLESIDNK